MNQEIAEQWVAALRSGEYKQGRCQLLTVHGEFCCLGVLCDLHNKQHRSGWEGKRYLGHATDLPKVVIGWAGMSSAIGRNDEAMSLMRLNDNGHTFGQIADIIERQWRNL